MDSRSGMTPPTTQIPANNSGRTEEAERSPPSTSLACWLSTSASRPGGAGQAHAGCLHSGRAVTAVGRSPPTWSVMTLDRLKLVICEIADRTWGSTRNLSWEIESFPRRSGNLWRATFALCEARLSGTTRHPRVPRDSLKRLVPLTGGSAPYSTH